LSFVAPVIHQCSFNRDWNRTGVSHIPNSKEHRLISWYRFIFPRVYIWIKRDRHCYISIHFCNPHWKCSEYNMLVRTQKKFQKIPYVIVLNIKRGSYDDVTVALATSRDISAKRKCQEAVRPKRCFMQKHPLYPLY
jgi:hypothetical protein